jgi:cell division protein FtsI (penicillin-binding protein 3)
MGKRSRLRTQGVGRRRLIVLLILLIGSAAVYGWYNNQQSLLLWEQVKKISGISKDQSSRESEIIRGTIYDRNYKELAISYERVSVYANIREIDNVNQVVAPLSAILETSEKDLYDRLGEGRLRVWLARDISQDQEDQIRRLDLSGVHLHREYMRYYPEHESAAHLVGFAERDTGLSGIEHYLNRLEAEYRLKENDTGDLPQMGDTRPGVDGRHLILTLDLKIQRILDGYLKKLSSSMPGVGLGALVMEADSGALVGYAQLPSFDPNKFHTYPEARFGDLFTEKIALPEPFKIFLNDLSLIETQAEKINPSLPWSVAAEQRKLGVQLQLWNKLGADNQEALDFAGSQSKDPDAAVFQSGLDQQRDFGTVPQMQTPLQVLTAITRAVNGGLQVRPQAGLRFVLRRNQQEFLLEDLLAKTHKQVLKEQVSQQARDLYGLLGVPGPLGTTLLQGESTSYRQGGRQASGSLYHHYLGVALIPLEKPELALLLTATGPGYQAGGTNQISLTGEALDMIAPIVALQRVMKNLADMMSPREQEEFNFRIPTGEEASARQLVRQELQTEMVSLVGMSLRKCLRLLQSSSVEIEIQGTGRVVAQQPTAGSALKPGDTVILSLATDQVDASYKKPSLAQPE